MFDEGFVFMKPSGTYFTCKLIFSGVFGHMVLQSGWALEQFTAVVARVPSAIVSSHMIFVVTFRDETWTTLVTEVWILACVMLVMGLQALQGSECFTTFVTLVNFAILYRSWFIVLNVFDILRLSAITWIDFLGYLSFDINNIHFRNFSYITKRRLGVLTHTENRKNIKHMETVKLASTCS